MVSKTVLTIALCGALLASGCGPSSEEAPPEVEPLRHDDVASENDAPRLPAPLPLAEDGAAAASAADAEDAEEPAAPTGPVAWPSRSAPMLRALYAGTWAPHEEDGFAHSWFDESALQETYSMRRAGRRVWKGISGSKLMRIDALATDRADPLEAYLYAISSRPPTNGLDAFAEGAYDDAEAILHLRHHGRVRAWWDSELVLDEDGTQDEAPRHSQVRVPLTDAFDVLVLKLGRGPEFGSSIDIDVRLSALDGEPLPGQDFMPRRKNEYPREID